MNKHFKLLVDIAGHALELEDRFFLGAISANQAAYPGEKGGILRINNERYFQFVVARALSSSFPFPVEVEVNSYDLVLKHPGKQEVFAVVEMKRWMSSTGNPEIKSIKHDINKKLVPAASEKALLLIFSANPIAVSIEENLVFLSKKLGISFPPEEFPWETYSFRTFTRDGSEVDFWVAAYEVPKGKQ